MLAGQQPIFEVPSLRIHSTVQTKVFHLIVQLAKYSHTRSTAGDGLFMPNRLVLLPPRHPLGGSLHHHLTLLQRRPCFDLAFSRMMSIPPRPRHPVLVTAFLHFDPSSFGIAVGAVQRPLDAGQKIEITINTLRRR